MIVVLAPGDVDAALALLKEHGESASVIGRVANGSRGVVIEE